MRAARAAVWLCLAALLCGPAVAEDDSGLERLTRREQLLGWEAVGRIDIVDGGFCTGTLIATNLVLTAAHCVMEPDGTPIDADRMTFRAGLADGTAIAEVAVRRTAAIPGYAVARSDLDQLGLDAALLELASDIPAAVAAPFVVESPGDGDEVSVVSYARGREEALSWQKVCSVLGRRSGLIAVNCNVTFGASGAPVLDRSFGRARIVSIISSGYAEQGAVVAFGMELPGIVDQLKARLRQGKALSEAGGAAAPAIRRIGAADTSRDTGARFVKP